MRQRLDVVDQRRPAEVAGLSGEWRSQPRHSAPPLHRLEHRRLLAADVRAGADHELDGEAARSDRLAQDRARRRVFLAEVDVRLVRLAEAHRRLEPLEEELRAELQHVAILDRPRLALVSVDDHDARAGLLSHRRPLPPGRKARATHTRQPRGFQPREHLVLGQLGRLAGFRPAGAGSRSSSA